MERGEEEGQREFTLQWMDDNYAFYVFECLMVNAAVGITSSTALCLCCFSSWGVFMPLTVL